MCYTIPAAANKCFFVSALTQTTHARPRVRYQRTHLCRRRPGTAMRSWAPWSGTALNQVLSSAGRSHGPLLILLWEGLDAYVKTVQTEMCWRTMASVFTLPAPPWGPSIPESSSVCVKGNQAFDMIHVTGLTFICKTYPPRPIVLSTSWYAILIRGKRPECKQAGRAPLLPSDPRALVWSLAWTEEIESFHLLVPEGCVVVRIRDEKGDRINAMARQTSAKRYFPA